MSREIIKAQHSGFCFGVKRAIDTAEKLIEEHDKAGDTEKPNCKIYSCGPLIHNHIVTDFLSDRGLSVIESLQEAAQGDVVLIRSHGEPKSFYDEAEAKGITLVDATCPFVKKIHVLVKEAEAQGKIVVIVGDYRHPEVVGINGWCNNSGIIVNSAEEAANIKEDNLFVVAQTTIQRKHLDKVVEKLRDLGKIFEVTNTICFATNERQNSCIEVAKQVDAMIVIGGKNSSNSKKLFDIAQKYCHNSYFVENLKDLPLKKIELCNKIGVAAGASTPETVIEEVIAKMSENITGSETNLMHDLMDEIEKSLRLPRTGEIVNGKILQVTEKELIVNLGCKKDGIVPKDEVSMEEGQKLTDLFKEGEEIQAKVIRTDDGDIVLSKRKLEVNENWDEVAAAYDEKAVLSVKVVRQVNGGAIAMFKEVSGFIPMSQLSDRFVENADAYIGKVLDVKVSRLDRMKGKVVFSHKMVLAEEKAKKITEIWDKLSVGDVVEGTVMRFTDYGAFVDIGGIDGLLHISEISWGKLKHPQEVLAIGDKIMVRILQMNAEKGKISLGYKQNKPEPWSVISENYAVGQIVEGRVVQIKEYGAFVELEPGLDGLVHISEVAHKRVVNIADEISVGQIVQAEILEIDTERKRISLSLKACIEAPAIEEAEEIFEEAEEIFEEAVVEAE